MQDKIQLAVDLGTNAEILLNNRGTLYACSTAAGPAFEGRGISHGRRARAGVINAVNCFVVRAISSLPWCLLENKMIRSR